MVNSCLQLLYINTLPYIDISTKINLLSTKSDVSLKSEVIFHHNGPEEKYNVENDLNCSPGHDVVHSPRVGQEHQGETHWEEESWIEKYIIKSLIVDDSMQVCLTHGEILQHRPK